MPRHYATPAFWEEDSFTAPDGTVFPRTSWLPVEGRRPKAVLIAIHGLGGATSDWWPLGETCQTHGMALYSYELRGMGNDPQPSHRGDLDRKHGWLQDFTSFTKRVREVYPDVPMVWVGESLGGVIVLNTLIHHVDAGIQPVACILTSPIVRVDGKIGGWREPLIKLAMCLAPRVKVDLQSLGNTDTASVKVVSNTTHRAQQRKTPHAITRYSLRLLSRVASLVRENRRKLAAVKVPILVFYGGHDVFTEPEEVDNWFLEIGSSDKQRMFVPDGYHLLLHDKDRLLVLRRIEKWLEGIINYCEEREAF